MTKLKNLLPLILAAVIDLISIFPQLTEYFSVECRIFILGIGVILYLLLCAWPNISFWFKKIYTRWKVARIGVSIRPDIDDTFVEHCNKSLIDFGLSSKIKFKKVKIKSIEEFRKKLVKKHEKVDVFICKSGKLRTKKKNIAIISFVYKDTTDNRIKALIDSEMASLVVRDRMFSFTEEDLELEISLEKENLKHFALYAAALCAWTFRGLDDAIYVFEKLAEMLLPITTVLKDSVNQRLGTLYMFKGRGLSQTKKHSESRTFLDKAHALLGDDGDVLAGLTVARFHLGDMEGAQKAAEILLEKFSNKPVAHLNGAFFRLQNGKYDSAITHYHIFKKMRPPEFVTREAIQFFDEIVVKDPQKLEYLFARAFLKEVMSDGKINGSTCGDDLDIFMRRSDPVKYKRLREEAEVLLKKNEDRILKRKRHSI